MRPYLIWSEEHGAWWMPASRGYTMSMRKAGHYPLERAMEIALQANAGGFFQEVPVMFTESMELACQLREPR